QPPAPVPEPGRGSNPYDSGAPRPSSRSGTPVPAASRQGSNPYDSGVPRPSARGKKTDLRALSEAILRQRKASESGR
ncbi:MAG: hypothetical protein JSR54_20590, partial [Proteobacteria bacterium]|nr:hypothetical protein [Pseudomonadota bacterium]